MRPPYPVIDAHVHVLPWDQLRPEVAERMAVQGDGESLRALHSDPHKLIGFMDERNIEKIVMVNYVSPQVTGPVETSNLIGVGMARHYPERLIPFGGIDPRRIDDVAGEMDYLLGELRMGGIKIHPPHQHLRVNDYQRDEALRGLATVYEKCIAYDAPLMVHTGTSMFPRARNKYGRPLDIDDVLVDFPELTIILAHGGRPLWMEEAFFLLRRSPNVYLDISSVPPKRLLDYFPWLDRVADKTMFGSDWPGPGVVDPVQNIEDFYELPISEENKRKILRDTAERIIPSRMV